MTTTADKLRELAAKVEADAARLTMSRERYTLASALAAVRAAVPSDRAVKISLNVWHHPHLHGPTVEWEIWDDRNHYRAPSLTAAVASCLAAHRPGDTLAEAEAALSIPADGADDAVVPLGVADELPTVGDPATLAIV